jgi:hypothetical protein
LKFNCHINEIAFKTMKKGNNISENFEDDMKRFAPKLSGINKTDPFTVPESYFDELPEMIADKCSADDTKATAHKRIILFTPKFFIPLTTGVSVIAVLFIVYIIPEMKVKKNNVHEIANSDKSAEELYVDTLIANNDMDETLLAQALINNDTSKNARPASAMEHNIKYLNKSNVVIDDTVNKIQITDDDIIQYLKEDKDIDNQTDF